MHLVKKDLTKDLKIARNFIIIGLVIILVSLYPMFLINDFPKESDLIEIKDVLIAKTIKKQNKGAKHLELTLKTHSEKLTISDLAYKKVCENCSDLKVGDSILIGILKENLDYNKVYSIKSKQKEILILKDYELANKQNNQKFIILFVFLGLTTIGLGIWMRGKIMASR